MPSAIVAADAVVGPEPDFANADRDGKNVIGGQAVFLGVVGPGGDQRSVGVDPRRQKQQENGAGKQKRDAPVNSANK